MFSIESIEEKPKRKLRGRVNMKLIAKILVVVGKVLAVVAEVLVIIAGTKEKKR